MACFHIHFKLHMGIPDLPALLTVRHCTTEEPAHVPSFSLLPAVPTVLGAMVQDG